MTRGARTLSFLLFVGVSLSLSPSVLAQATGTWQGTFTVTEPCGETGTLTYSVPATLPLVQTGNAVTALLALSDVPLITEDCQTAPGLPLTFPITGQLVGTTFTGTLLSGTDPESGPQSVTGSITGNSLSFSFPDEFSTVVFTATRTSSATPSNSLSGAYSGSYSGAFKVGEFCPNLSELMFSGSLAGPLTQLGNAFSGVFTATGGKALDVDDNGNCVPIDGGDFEIVVGGTINGNAIVGGAFGFLIVSPFSGSVSGTSFTGSGENDFSRFNFAISRTSATPAPTITRFDAQPSSVQQGQSTTLTWTTVNADSVTIDNGVGLRPASGSVSVSPSVTTTYTLTATGLGGTATRTTTVSVGAQPARVAVTSFPNGMVQLAGQATASDRFTVTNLGGTATTLTVTQSGAFFSQTPTSFTLAPGASQVVVIRANEQQQGNFEGTSIVTGPGTPGLIVPVRLVVAAPPTAPVVPAPNNIRPELSAPADQNPMGSVDFTNSGAGVLQGLVTSDASWLVPQSSALTIPAGQTRTVTFTSDRSLRPDADAPVGGTAAKLSIAYFDFINPPGLTASQASSTTTPTNISVSIVDVIKPGVAGVGPPALAAGERAVFAPGLPQRTNSLGDLLLSATGTGSIADLRLFFTGPGASALSTSLSQIIPNTGISLPSVLKNVFSTSAPSGTVQVRTASADRVSIAAVQTNTASRIGSYITALPTFRSDRSAPAGQRIFLAGVEKGTSRFTNLYVQETSGNAGGAQIDFFGPGGNVIASRPADNLTAFGLLELPDVVPAGASAVRVTNTGSGPSTIVAYALVVDTGTQDAWLVRDSALDGDATGVIVPVVPGPGNATTQTSLYVLNPGTTPLTVTFDTIRSGATRRRSARSTTSSNSLKLEENVVTSATLPPMQTLIAQTGVNTGYVRVSAPAAVSVSARATVTAAGRPGNFGSALPPIAPATALGTGQSRRFSGVDDSAQRTIDSRTPVTYRSNLGLLETTGQTAVVRVTLRYTFSAGTRTTAQGVSTKELSVAGNQLLLVGELSKTVIGPQRETFGDLRNMQLDVEVVGGSGRVIPFLQTIDNGSLDMSVRQE